MTRGTLPNVICFQLSGFAPPPKHAWFLRKNKSPSSLRTRACFVAGSHVFGRCAKATYPPAPLFASLIVGYACAHEERGAQGFLRVCLPSCFDGFERMNHAMKKRPIPRPLSCEERGAHGCLKVCIPGCFDGFGRMDHAIEPKKPLDQSLGRPITVPPSS